MNLLRTLPPLLISFLSLFLVMTRLAQAASCCGSSVSLPALITGVDKAQFATSLSQGRVIGERKPGKTVEFWPAEKSHIKRTIKVDGAYLLSEYWQVGASLPYSFNDYQTTTGYRTQGDHLGDISVLGAYEFLPETRYHPWKPRGFVFARWTLPTGVSPYDSREGQMVDVTGRGFHSASLGLAFVRSWQPWTVEISGETHYSFSRHFSINSRSTLVSPGFGASASVSAGYRLKNWRLGYTLAPYVEGPIRTKNQVTSTRSSDQIYWDSSLSLAYLWSQWSVSGVYTDQTLFGPVRNTQLVRSWTLVMQKRWAL